MKRVTILLAALCMLALSVRGENTPVTTIMVVGTIHQHHEGNNGYGYEDISRILDAYQPDVICVEIRPTDFRTQSYLKEMMLATVYGISKGIDVIPIDWWNNDLKQQSMNAHSLPDFSQKRALADSAMRSNAVIAAFEEAHGNYSDFIRSKPSFEEVNSEVFCNYIKARYHETLTYCGDGPMSMFWTNRNDSMFTAIGKAVAQNKGRRIIVLTGAEHKYYFDEKAVALPFVEVVSPISLKIDRSTPVDSMFASALYGFNYTPYFNSGSEGNMIALLRNEMLPLVHGKNMDFNPGIIPVANVKKAQLVLSLWSKTDSLSMEYLFEKAWLGILLQEPQQALIALISLEQSHDMSVIESQIIRLTFYRNMGLCYDMMGMRQEALGAYRKGKAMLRTDREKAIEKLLYSDYDEKPYTPKSTDAVVE